jgi:hypothetical protein
LVAKLEGIVGSEFEQVDYGEAIRVLERANENFEFPVKWGIDLQSEHERYLTVRWLPETSQDELARTILHLAGSEAEAGPVDPAHLAAVLEGLAQAKRREIATDDAAEAAFRRFDR